MITEPAEVGGLGFDATWFAKFYHHLIGDTGHGPDYANLLWTAGMGGNGPLAMDAFAGVLAATGRKTIVYHESHDEAGNSHESRRTLAAALALSEGEPPAEGEVRLIAEARCRFAAGMALLAAGTPMFLMGEEIGAVKDFRFNDFLQPPRGSAGGPQRQRRAPVRLLPGPHPAAPAPPGLHLAEHRHHRRPQRRPADRVPPLEGHRGVPDRRHAERPGLARRARDQRGRVDGGQLGRGVQQRQPPLRRRRRDQPGHRCTPRAAP